MAEEVELEVAPSKSKLPLIIAVVVVLLIAGGAAAYFLLGSEQTDDADSAAAEPATEETVSPAQDGGQALYVAMPRPFVFTVPGAKRERMVQVKVQLLVRGSEAEQLAKKHIPLVEGTLLKTFSASTAEELMSLTGKERIREQALTDIRQAFVTISGGSVVEQVLFTGFVLQ